MRTGASDSPEHSCHINPPDCIGRKHSCCELTRNFATEKQLNMFRKLYSVVALLFVVTLIYAQTTDEKLTVNRLKTYLSQMEKAGFYGSVLVDIRGEKVISNGYGYRDYFQKARNSANTIFDIGSITKQFTASAILKLEMQGKLSIKDEISMYFDSLPVDKRQITIHDLLRHQSGLISNVGRDFEKISASGFLDKVFSFPLQFAPGTGFSYSNIGYSLLAMIIEKVSNHPYETYLYENLWKPAQMEMTGYSRPRFDTAQIAVGYETNNKIWGKPTDKAWDTGSPYWHLKGNGGILSTTEDLYKWHRCLMTEMVLSKDAKQKLYSPELRAGETKDAYYAYGWDVSKTDRGTTQIWHNGTNNILYADFLRYVDENTVMILLSNKSHPNFNQMNFEVARMIFIPSYTPEIPPTDNPVNRAFTNKIIETINNSGISKAKELYRRKKKNEQLLEFVMRNNGFEYLDNKKPDIAIQIFEMNVFVYPTSARALQGLGEGYMETGKKELAIKYFRQSLQFNAENPFVKAMLKRLED